MKAGSRYRLVCCETLCTSIWNRAFDLQCCVFYLTFAHIVQHNKKETHFMYILNILSCMWGMCD
jgi:hypothetical protein